MARKTREPLTEAPPPANSSSSEESSDEEENEEEDQEETHSSSSSSSSSSDDEKTPSPVPDKPSSLKKKKIDPPKPTHSDVGSSKLNNPGSNPSSKTKRPPLESEKVPTKKTKTSEDDGKKVLFQRVWSEDDELVILKGMIDYKANKGIDPMADPDGFFDFVKKGLHFGDANKAQLVNKVQRMKKKFENPKRRKFNNPHDLQAFQLSKQLWGITDGVEDNNKTGENRNLNASNAKASKGSMSKLEATEGNGLVLEVRKKMESKKKNEDEMTNWVVSSCDRETTSLGLGGSSIGLFLSEGVLKQGVKLLSDKDKADLNEKWRKHNLEEMEVYLKRLDLIREVTEKSLKALKSA